LGLKKMFSTPPIITIASFRSRWTALEQFSYYYKSSLPNPNSPSIVDTYANAIKNLTEQYQQRDEKQLESKYIHWLEWTFGFEYLYIKNNISFAMGASFGFRTPLKFWKNDESETDSPETEVRRIPLPISDHHSTL